MSEIIIRKITSKLTLRINKLKKDCQKYQDALQKRKNYARQTQLLIDQLLTDGRITKEELSNYYKNYVKVKERT